MPDLRPTQLFQVEPSLAKTWQLYEPGVWCSPVGAVSIPGCFPVLDRLLLSLLCLS